MKMQSIAAGQKDWSDPALWDKKESNLKLMKTALMADKYRQGVIRECNYWKSQNPNIPLPKEAMKFMQKPKSEGSGFWAALEEFINKIFGGGDT